MTGDACFVQPEAALGSPANRNLISSAGFAPAPQGVVLLTPQGVAMIDAPGSPALGQPLMAKTRRLAAQAVRQVVVTRHHAHPVCGGQVFKDQGAIGVAHHGGRECLNSDTAARTDGRRFQALPLVRLAGGIKACNIDLLKEQQGRP